MSSHEGSITEEIIEEYESTQRSVSPEVIEDENEENHGEVQNEVEAADNNLEGEGDENDEEDDNKKTVKPKKIVRNPQPKLNEQTIQGPRGIAAIQRYFERVKFKGKGYEEQDLNVIMKTYEYWSHRLFPKFPFDASIERLENLGFKRATKTHIKRIRHDLLVDDKEIIEQDDNDGIHLEGFVDVETNNQFEQLRDHLSTTTEPAQSQSQPTEEQLERMRQNREKAIRLRQEKLRKAQERAKETLEPLGQLPENITSSTSAMEVDIISTVESDSQFDIRGTADIQIEDNYDDGGSNLQGTISKTSLDDNESIVSKCSNKTASKIYNILESDSDEDHPKGKDVKSPTSSIMEVNELDSCKSKFTENKILERFQKVNVFTDSLSNSSESFNHMIDDESHVDEFSGKNYKNNISTENADGQLNHTDNKENNLVSENSDELKANI